MIVYHLTNSQAGKISFYRHDQTAKTSSSNWKPFGFRSADAHTRARVRAGGGVEPAARSSHKPPDARKEAAKTPGIARRQARSAGTCANRVRTDRRARFVRSGAQPRSFVPDILLFCGFVGWSRRARGAGARQTHAPQLRREQAEEIEDRNQKGIDAVPIFTGFLSFFAGDVCARARGKKRGVYREEGHAPSDDSQSLGFDL